MRTETAGRGRFAADSLGGGQARKGGAAALAGVVAAVVAVVAALAVVGFYVTGGDLANLSEVAGRAAPPGGRTGAGGRRAGAELVAVSIAEPTTWQAGMAHLSSGWLVFVESGARLVIEPA